MYFLFTPSEAASILDIDKDRYQYNKTHEGCGRYEITERCWGEPPPPPTKHAKMTSHY